MLGNTLKALLLSTLKNVVDVHEFKMHSIMLHKDLRSWPNRFVIKHTRVPNYPFFLMGTTLKEHVLNDCKLLQCTNIIITLVCALDITLHYIF